MKKLLLILALLLTGTVVYAGGDKLIQLPPQKAVFKPSKEEKLGVGFYNPRTNGISSSGTSTIGDPLIIGSTIIRSTDTSTFGGQVVATSIFAPSSTQTFGLGYNPTNISSGTVRDLNIYGQSATNTHGGAVNIILGTAGQGNFFRSLFRLKCDAGQYECLNIGPMTQNYTIINQGNSVNSSNGIQFGYNQGATSSASLIVKIDKTSENYWHVRGDAGAGGPILEASSTTNANFGAKVNVFGPNSTLAIQINSVTSTMNTTSSLFTRQYFGFATGTNGGFIQPPSAASGGQCILFSLQPIGPAPISTSTIPCPAGVNGAF